MTKKDVAKKHNKGKAAGGKAAIVNKVTKYMC